MTLDPQVAALLPQLDFPAVETMTAQEARIAIRARRQPPSRPEQVADTVGRAIPGLAGDVPVRIYWPMSPAETGVPAVVFAHGGGFVLCDLDTHGGLCRSMANGVGAVVVSVDYWLAPEAPWPAAADDFYAATQWVADHPEELGADPRRIVVAGDSAGGNLAIVITLLSRDRHGPQIACQTALYPVIAADFTTESYRRFGTGFYNTRAAMSWYWDQYVPAIADRAHPYVSPIAAELTDCHLRW